MYARGRRLSIERRNDDGLRSRHIDSEMNATRTAEPARTASRASTASASRDGERPHHGAAWAAPGVHAAGTTAEGTVSANRAGYGFVRVEGLKDSVFLPPREMRGRDARRPGARARCARRQ